MGALALPPGRCGRKWTGRMRSASATGRHAIRRIWLHPGQGRCLHRNRRRFPGALRCAWRERHAAAGWNPMRASRCRRTCSSWHARRGAPVQRSRHRHNRSGARSLHFRSAGPAIQAELASRWHRRRCQVGRGRRVPDAERDHRGPRRFLLAERILPACLLAMSRASLKD